jgi:Flp pilus assembly protein TadD
MRGAGEGNGGPHGVFWPGAGFGIWCPPLLLVAMAGLVYGKAVTYDFSNLDDIAIVQLNPIIRDLNLRNLKAIFTEFSLFSYYPVRALSLAFDYALWGENPGGYHLTNIILHICNTLIFYMIAIRIAKTTKIEYAPSWHSAFLASSLFCLHPLLVEPVILISCREELLTLFFSFISIMLNDIAYESSGPKKYALYLLCSYTVLCACFSNITGAMLPALICAWNIVILKDTSIKSLFSKTWHLWIFALIAISLKFLARLSYNPTISVLKYKNIFEAIQNFQDLMMNPVVADKLSKTISIRKYFVFSLFNDTLTSIVWPYQPKLLYQVKFPSTFLDFYVISGLFLMASLFFLAWRNRKDTPILIGLVWFFITLFPSMQILPNPVQRADRFLYLPMPGFALAAASLAVRDDARRAAKGARILFAILVALFGVKSSIQSTYWKDGITLHHYNYLVSPEHSNAWYHYGQELARIGRKTEALQILEEGFQKGGRHPLLLEALSNFYIKAGMFEQAIGLVQKDMAENPGSPTRMNNLGVTYGEAGKSEQALIWLEKAVRLAPYEADFRYNLAAELTLRGDYRKAAAQLLAAVALDPRNAQAHGLLGQIYQVRGETAKAAHHKAIAQKLTPAWPQGVARRQEKGLMP